MLRSGFWFGSGLRQRTADSFSKRWTLKGALLAGAVAVNAHPPGIVVPDETSRRNSNEFFASIPNSSQKAGGPPDCGAAAETDTRPNANADQGMPAAMTGTSLQRIIATQGSAVKATSRPTLFLLASNQPSRTSPLSSAGDRPLNLVRLSSFR
jgi:hypothetical protein